MNVGNLFRGIQNDLKVEQTDTLVATNQTRIERIVSTGQRSPDGFWYDQEEEEWVAVLTGSAIIEFDDGADDVQLSPGDWINIAAHRRHRIAWTTEDEPTIWIAVFSANAEMR